VNIVTEQSELTVADVATKAQPPEPGRLSTRLIENVEVELQAFLGSAGMTVAELTALAPGTEVALRSPLNASVELRLNGVALAHGELVAVGDKFGVRLTEIVPWPK
jgi:flagellar motor switch protein FliN/FliY